MPYHGHLVLATAIKEVVGEEYKIGDDFFDLTNRIGSHLRRCGRPLRYKFADCAIAHYRDMISVLCLIRSFLTSSSWPSSNEVELEDSALVEKAERGIMAFMDALVPGAAAEVARRNETEKARIYHQLHVSTMAMMSYGEYVAKVHFFVSQNHRLGTWLKMEREVMDAPKEEKEKLMDSIKKSHLKEIPFELTADLYEWAIVTRDIDQVSEELQGLLKQWKKMKKNESLKTSSRFLYWYSRMQKNVNFAAGDIDALVRKEKKKEVKEVAKGAYASIADLKKKLEEVKKIFTEDRRAANEAGTLAVFDEGRHLSSKETKNDLEGKQKSSSEIDLDQLAASPVSPTPSMNATASTTASALSIQLVEIPSSSLPQPRFTKYVADIDEQYFELGNGLCHKYPKFFNDMDSSFRGLSGMPEIEPPWAKLDQLWKGDDWKAKLTEEGLEMAKKAEAQRGKYNHPSHLLEHLVRGDEDDDEDEIEEEEEERVVPDVEELEEKDGCQKDDENRMTRKKVVFWDEIDNTTDDEESESAFESESESEDENEEQPKKPQVVCALPSCRAALAPSFLLCGACQKHSLRPFSTRFKMAYYCGRPCMLQDWEERHRTFHKVMKLVWAAELGFSLVATI